MTSSSANLANGIVVAQLGSRRHYAVPQALHSRGLLQHFYTDGTGDSKVLHWLATLACKLVPARATRFLARPTTGLPAGLVTSFDAFGIAYRFIGRLFNVLFSPTRTWLWGGKRFCRMVAERTGNAKAFYAFSSSALELFEAAKAMGAMTILDHATAPRRFEDDLVKAEHAAFPDLFPPFVDDPLSLEYDMRQKAERELADLIICGSTFVARALDSERLPGRIVIVPLGVECERITPREAGTCRELRILFTGDDAPRKGLGYLLQALELLNSPRCEARAVGQIALSSTGVNRVSKRIKLLGRLDRHSMEDQYAWADVIVMPSVSDTFGLTVLEAMAQGRPVIITPNTGAADIVRNGEDGFIVPLRSPEAIADKLDVLLGNQKLAVSMRYSALARAREYSATRYADRLVHAICGVCHEEARVA